MAGSKQKKNKQVKTKFDPTSKNVVAKENPDAFYSKKPSWRFHNRDKEMWKLTQETLFNIVLPKLESFETQTYGEIFLRDKKHNHGISLQTLNTVAAKRAIAYLPIETESLYSLHLDNTTRIYGHIVDGVFHILWYDDEHGDNDTCVCRSRQKHT